MSQLSTHELELLESIAGVRTHHADGRPIAWGAWMSVCLESLEGRGLVDRYAAADGSISYSISFAGQQVVARTTPLTSGKQEAE